jgi:hypothetical protein
MGVKCMFRFPLRFGMIDRVPGCEFTGDTVISAQSAWKEAQGARIMYVLSSFSVLSSDIHCQNYDCLYLTFGMSALQLIKLPGGKMG